MPKPLKIWNGLATHVMCAKHGDPQWIAARAANRSYQIHAYVCANSRADALRLIAEYADLPRGAAHAIQKYWHMGSWGNSMNGITPERGLWLQFGSRTPVRVI